MQQKKHLRLLAEEQQKAEHPAEVNPLQVHQQSLRLNDKIALLLTGVYGSMYFVYALVLFMAGWMVWQSITNDTAFDPFPFVFLLFLGNLIQLLGGPIIQVGQNLAGRKQEVKIEQDHTLSLQMFALLQDMREQLSQVQEELAWKEVPAEDWKPPEQEAA